MYMHSVYKSIWRMLIKLTLNSCVWCCLCSLYNLQSTNQSNHDTKVFLIRCVVMYLLHLQLGRNKV